VIGDGAFSPTGFSSLTIPEGVVSIGEGVFPSSADLEYLILPRSLERIGSAPLYGKIYYCGTEEEWAEVESKIAPRRIYFYRETEPEEEGKYWHYINGDAVAW